MQNSISKTLWGIVFIILGIGFAGKALGFFDFNPFFIGWWTMFILVPSGIGLLTPGKRLSSFVGFVTGMACLALVNSWIQWDLLIRLWIPFLFIVLGLNIIKKGVLISPKIKPNDAIFSNENRPKENQTKENQTSENQTAENIKVDINIKTNKDNSWNKDIYIYHNNDFKQKTDTNGTNDSTSNTYSENRKNE